MFCRRIVILSGEDGSHGSAKGLLQLTAEQEGVSARLTLQNLAPVKLDYGLVLRVGERVEYKCFSACEHTEITWRASIGVRDVDRICALVGLVQSAKPVLYGSNSGLPLWESGLQRLLAEKTRAAAKVTEAQQKQVEAREAKQAVTATQAEQDGRAEPSLEQVVATKEQVAQQPRYNDEAEVEDNYYPTSFLTYIEGGKRAAGLEQKRVTDWDSYNVIYRPRLARPQKTADAPTSACESAACAEPQGAPYYEHIATAIETLFSTCEAECDLNQNLPGTSWVRVSYRKGTYYCVGRIGGSARCPDYIGYAVPGEYALNPPREFDGLCKWLPKREDAPHGQGYWLMFQDAQTGASLRLKGREWA